MSAEQEVGEEPNCVANACAYPETCRWNGRCMEEGMQESKAANMAREDVLRKAVCGESVAEE